MACWQGKHLASDVKHKGQEWYSEAKHEAKEGAGQLAGIVKGPRPVHLSAHIMFSGYDLAMQ